MADIRLISLRTALADISPADFTMFCHERGIFFTN